MTTLSDAHLYMPPAPRIVIYSALAGQLYNLTPGENRPNGTWEQNGCTHLEDLTEPFLRSLRDLGATHLWLIGLIRHATATDLGLGEDAPTQNPAIVKGAAGSPYAVTDYYDIHPTLVRRPRERVQLFTEFLARCHRVGLRLVMDFVPNHVSREYRSTHLPEGETDLGAEDLPDGTPPGGNNFYYLPGQSLTIAFTPGTYYREYPARATGNDRFTTHLTRDDWYETVKLNYSPVPRTPGGEPPIPSTWLKMLHILQFWVGLGVDGFRCDMAHMVPTEFWQWAIPQVKAVRPAFFLAELYDTALYPAYLRAGFDCLYDKSGLYDRLRAHLQGQPQASNLLRTIEHNRSWGSKLLYFLENHDEQRLPSPFFAGSPAPGVPAMTLCALSGTASQMIYFGQELGEAGTDAEGFSGYDGRTSIFDYYRRDKLNRRADGGHFPESPSDSEETNRGAVVTAHLRRAYIRCIGRLHEGLLLSSRSAR